jgi:hypothetical protein
MRDEKRIERILEKIKILWEDYPDTRFFQLISNFKYNYNGDMFNYEDSEFEKVLDAELKKRK